MCAQYDFKAKEIVFSEKFIHPCNLSAELKSLVEQMLVDLFQMDYGNDAFDKFFQQSKYITSLRYVHVIDFENFDFFNVALEPNQK
jgi:hypothetical protein